MKPPAISIVPFFHSSKFGSRSLSFSTYCAADSVQNSSVSLSMLLTSSSVLLFVLVSIRTDTYIDISLSSSGMRSRARCLLLESDRSSGETSLSKRTYQWCHLLEDRNLFWCYAIFYIYWYGKTLLVVLFFYCFLLHSLYFAYSV